MPFDYEIPANANSEPICHEPTDEQIAEPAELQDVLPFWLQPNEN